MADTRSLTEEQINEYAILLVYKMAMKSADVLRGHDALAKHVLVGWNPSESQLLWSIDGKHIKLDIPTLTELARQERE